MKPKMLSLAFVLAACVAGLLSPALHAQERRTDDSTGVQPLRGSPVLSTPYVPAQTASNSGTIPFSYSSYGAITNAANAGVASYWMTGSTVVVAMIGAAGNSVNQSPPQLQDTAGQVYRPASSNCRVASSSCNASFNIVGGRTPGRLYVYSQGNNPRN